MSMSFAMSVLESLVLVFAFVVGLCLLAALVVLIIDRMQTEDAIRRNYPVIGRFRHVFSVLGEFFSTVFLCDGSRGIAV
jgi:hypothetical protein